MSGIEGTCLSLAAAKAVEHIGHRTPAAPVANFCSLAAELRRLDLSVLTHQPWLASLLPTGICLRMRKRSCHTTSPKAFATAMRKVQDTHRPYCIITLSSAAAMYGLRENWAHAIVFLGFPNFRIQIYDPLKQVDPTYNIALIQMRIDDYVDNNGAICALIWNSL